MSKITKERLADLEEMTFELMFQRVKEGTATASEIREIMRYLGEKGYQMALDPNEDAAEEILKAADADEDIGLPFPGAVQ